MTPASTLATDFTHIQSLTGGSGDDTFSLADGVGLSGRLNGGGGTNTLNYSAYTSDVTINLATGQATNIFGGAGGGISNLQSFIGPIGETNSLTAGNTNNTWVINGVDSGTVNGTVFANFKNITGGSSSDSFRFSTAGVITGLLDGSGGENTVYGANQDTIWSITSLGKGILPTTGGFTSFQNIQYAVGGTANDTFLFSDGATFYLVNGGGGAPEVNTLDYSLYTTTVYVSFSEETATNLIFGFYNIQNVVGNYRLLPPVSEYKYAEVKVSLALSQTEKFLNMFNPLDLFLFYKYEIKDYEIVKNLKVKKKKILHPFLLQKEQVNTNIFEAPLIEKPKRKFLPF
jgi:hypothetical protein